MNNVCSLYALAKFVQSGDFTSPKPITGAAGEQIPVWSDEESSTDGKKKTRRYSNDFIDGASVGLHGDLPSPTPSMEPCGLPKLPVYGKCVLDPCHLSRNGL